MADRGNAVPETPQNWGEYSRMLGDLPLRSLPTGADGRLQARLATEIASPRPRRPWLAGGLSIVGASLAVVAGMTIFASDEPPAATAPVRPTIVSEEKTKRRPARRAQPPRRVGPQFGETPVTIDTNIPPHIPLERRAPEVTTGGDRHDARPGNGASKTQQGPRTAP